MVKGKKPYAEDWTEKTEKCLTKYFEYENETELTNQVNC